MIKLSMDVILNAYVAAECLPKGTPIYLDDEGDVAYPDSPGATNAPPEYLYLCEAHPDRFPPSNFTVFADEDNQWRVSGYGNSFESKPQAMEFAMNTVGLEMEDIDEFIEYLRENISNGTFAA